MDVPSAADDSLAAQFARRVATRDDPPPPPPDRFAPAQVAARLGAAAAKKLEVRDPRRRRNLGLLLRTLVEHPTQTRTELAEAIGISPSAAADLAALLITAGLLDHGWRDGRWHWYALSRAGEDWALPIVQDEAF